MAVLGEEALLPPPPGQQHPTGNAGLLCIYAALGAALLCSFAEGWLSLRLVQRWRKAFESSGGARASGSAGDGSGLATQPLLGKAGGGGEERDKASATIPELIGLSAPDTHILMLAFTAGAAAALGLVGWVGGGWGPGHACALPAWPPARTETAVVWWVGCAGWRGSLDLPCTAPHQPAGPHPLLHRQNHRLRVHRPRPPCLQADHPEDAGGGAGVRRVHRHPRRAVHGGWVGVGVGGWVWGALSSCGVEGVVCADLCPVLATPRVCCIPLASLLAPACGQVAMTRLNVRIRQQLFASLMGQASGRGAGGSRGGGSGG